MTDKEKTCKNCGKILSDENYCPQCGQAASTGRLTTRNFLTEALTGLTRLNRGFLFTCLLLLKSPWRVISDYIHGKRKNYTGPVQTLIVLCFLAIFLDSLFGSSIVSQTKQEISQILTEAKLSGILRQMADWYATSPTFQYLIIFLPSIPAFMLATRKAGHYRYNLAESLVAAIYTSCGMLVVAMLFEPLNHLSPYIESAFASNLYVLIMGSIGVYKAIRPLCSSKGKSILRLIGFYGLSAFNYVILLMLFGMIVALCTFPWDTITSTP